MRALSHTHNHTLSQVSVVVYTVNDILERYPSTIWPIVMDPKIWKKFKDLKFRNGFSEWVAGVFQRLSSKSRGFFSKFLGMGYVAFLNFLVHEPSFVWLYDYECRTSKTAYNAIWVTEADAVFSGKENKFLDFYEGADSDLVDN